MDYYVQQKHLHHNQGPVVDAAFSWCTDYSLQLST